MATTQTIFLAPEGRWQKKVEGRRRDSWRRPKQFSWHQKEGDKKKLRVVAVTHGDDPKQFSCRQKEGDKKKLRVVAVTHGDDPKQFSCCQKEGDKKKLKVVTLTDGYNPQFCFFECLP